MKYRILNPKQQFGFQQLTTNKLILFNNSRSFKLPKLLQFLFSSKDESTVLKIFSGWWQQFRKKKIFRKSLFLSKNEKKMIHDSAREKRCTKKI